MTVHRHRVNDDANSRVAAYESLLDLFTLFSFILIFAAFIYVTQFSQSSKNWASVMGFLDMIRIPHHTSTSSVRIVGKYKITNLKALADSCHK